ncbi:GroES-like protein [Setomelanomma holmii]|uniref:GroES-like protein n=1 Tax=Setomelanomma holmii TaxID=210430 RepID=A0A9P4H3L0_9PLEO|nr:GroES-like protein [Setomelanomma holmii]
MPLPSEVTVFKGSKKGVAVAAKLTGRTSLKAKRSRSVSLTVVCGTDLHYIQDDMVLGHEGVGKVEAVGDSVTKIKVGDSVGFGYVKDGCGECDVCQKGNCFYCKVAPRQYSATDHDQDSFSTYAVWPETNLHNITDRISDAQAAPLLCAGLAVFTPMNRHGIKPRHRVGILGIGGLGHLAIQFAAKLGAEVAQSATSNPDWFACLTCLS